MNLVVGLVFLASVIFGGALLHELAALKEQIRVMTEELTRMREKSEARDKESSTYLQAIAANTAPRARLDASDVARILKAIEPGS